MPSITRSVPLALVAGAVLFATPAVAQVPTPESVIGFPVGADGHLAEWSQIVDYFGQLDEASPAVRVERIGHTAMGRPMIMALITSPENQARLDEIKANQARLADPRGVPQAELDRLIANQPAVGFIGASLHGNEIMATQMSMELAYDLATDPAMAPALEDVVLVLVPGMNPDGLDITRSWWLETRNTEFEGARMPWLYHFYTGHDNNRDFFMATQPETQAVTRVLYKEWFPQVVYDVHQMGNDGARFFVPPFDDPLNPNIHPLIVRMTNLVGTQMALDLTEKGKTGIQHQSTFDLWWHGGGRTVPARHNMIGILSEAASVNYGDPIVQNPDSIDQPRIGSMFPEAWEGGVWSPRDIVEYELIASKSLINLLHRQRHDFVQNMVKLASDQVAMGREGGPFAYVLPPEQTDPGSAAEMLRVLKVGGVEIHEATESFTAGGETYPAGTRVVLMAQPYRAHAKDLLEPQDYPELRLWPGGPQDAPYDAAGWTLPYQMGVDARVIAEPFPTNALVEMASIPVKPGEVAGSGDAYALDPAMNNTHRAIHEVLDEGGEVTFSASPISAGGETWPAGTAVVSGVGDLDQRVQRWAQEWGVDAAGVSNVDGRTMDELRVGLYKPWTASSDEGWTRWIFEQWNVPFDTIHDAQIRGGDLASEFDAIVIPDLSYRSIVEGSDPDENPPQYAGGIGQEGAAALEAFVNAGGTLILLDSSIEFGIEALGLPIVDLEDAQDDEDYDRWYAPGSLLRVEWNTDHPIALGMPEESAVYYARGPVMDVQSGAEGITVVARYPESDILMSGYAQGEDLATGQPALIEAEFGEGKVVLFGFRPQHRAQPHDTFKVLFNALYR
ncbi:MAG TPA: M14 metallopeptidase family protein [Longimicrobiaceae bacterium]|nr:M14 metallopeptidase family protein [Longimicrobiaceae bacterium]